MRSQPTALAVVLCLTLTMIPSTVHPASAVVTVRGGWDELAGTAVMRSAQDVKGSRLRLRGGEGMEHLEDIAASVEKYAGRNDEMRLKRQEIARVSRKFASKQKEEDAQRDIAGFDFMQEFKVGRMVEQGETLRPLPDRGLATVEKSEDDWLVHLKWSPRVADSPVEPLDLLLVPETSTFERARMWRGKPITGARVYCLRDTDSDEAFYFWMQEPALEADDVFFNIVDHALHPLERDDARPDQGWRWTSHMELSLKEGLHLRLVSSDGSPHQPELPGTGAEYWEELAQNVSAAHKRRWLAGGARGGLQLEEGSGTVAVPQFRPRGGQHWMYWEPYGATRLTHWDPISISCATPGATVRYKFAENYDEVWEGEEHDEEPQEWEEYTGPFSLPRPGLHDEMEFEGWRVKAAAMKEGLEDSPVAVAEFLVYIHHKDLGRLRLQDYLCDTDTMWNLTHPATIEWDRRHRRAALARKRYWAEQVAKHEGGEINETTEQIFDLEEEELGRTTQRPEPEQGAGEAMLPPGAAALDKLTGQPLDAEGFPVMAPTRMGGRGGMAGLGGLGGQGFSFGGVPGAGAGGGWPGVPGVEKGRKEGRRRGKEPEKSLDRRGEEGKGREGSAGPREKRGAGGAAEEGSDAEMRAGSTSDKAGASSSLGLDEVVTSLQSTSLQGQALGGAAGGEAAGGSPSPSRAGESAGSGAGGVEWEGGSGGAGAGLGEVRLRDVLSVRGLPPALHAKLVEAALSEGVAALVPPGDDAAEVLRSPQFAQAVDQVEAVILQGMGQGLCAALGLSVDPNVLAAGGPRAVWAVLEAVRRKAGEEGEDEPRE